MKIFDNLKKVEEDEPIDKEPISEQSIKDLINLIEAANTAQCSFEIKFKLKDGDFLINSEAFENIKFIKKTKSTEANILITYNNALLMYNVTIQLNDIVGVVFNLTFCAKNGE